MDTTGIDGAMNWSSEIVNALNDCQTVLFLISKHSVSSHNCAKEIHLASEKRKNILPVLIEEIQLPVIFEYPLAGLHKLKINDTKGIEKALAKLREGKSAHHAMHVLSNKDYAGLHRLAVLPFDDLSPSHDNEWFADGMMDELIGTLGSLSKLIVPGRSSVMVYKKERPKASVIGEELEVRYIVEGTVRKAGEKIRISASLTDTKTDAQLWNNKFDGTLDDIFDFQERVAREITEGLKLKLTPEDVKKIEEKLTDNPEAYELFKKANIYANRQTKQDLLYAIDCLEEAVKLDPAFATAYAVLSRVSVGLSRYYKQNDSYLMAATEAVEKARKLNPDLPVVYRALSTLHLQRGENEEAIRAAKKMVELDPKNPASHVQLGFTYSNIWQPEEVAMHYEEAILLDPTDVNVHFNLCLDYDRLKDIQARNHAAERALPYYERYLKKNPDDQTHKMSYSVLLGFLGRTEESLGIADELIAAPNADGVTIYNCACMIAKLGEPQKAIAAFAKAAEKGFASLGVLLRNNTELGSLREIPEFEELKKNLEETKET